MTAFKCKMCGGTLNIKDGMSVCECEYCGTTQTVSKSDNEQTINMLNRATHFRQQCEFDKAMEIYEKLLDNNNSDSEIYWQIVLCRYGIEYVDDPLTKKKIPTCHRTQYNSIFNDADYIEAVNYADEHQKIIYNNEAQEIDRIQKEILEISSKEKPFDVFICYKESDENGKRTPDSVLAQDLYYQLEREGFKVFFSKITLEGKLGTAYEPYIFAALNSAKVMVVVGTKQEYFNAVWVKNEWSRFLMLMQKDKTKTLIPAYKNIDPYDLPEELSYFQAQDMSKLGFMQDLIRGIKNISKSCSGKSTVSESTDTNSTEIKKLLKRVFMFLEESEWSSAKEYCEKILDIEPECAEAYLGKLMVDLKVNYKRKLSEHKLPFKDNYNYKKAMKFADDHLKEMLKEYSDDANETAYIEATNEFNSKNYAVASSIFQQLNDYKDSYQKNEECEKKINEINKEIENNKKDEIIATAERALINDDEKKLEESIQALSSIQEWKNANEILESCQKKLKVLKKDSDFSKNIDSMIDSIDEKSEDSILIKIIRIVLTLIFFNWLAKKFIGMNLINIISVIVNFFKS